MPDFNKDENFDYATLCALPALSPNQLATCSIPCQLLRYALDHYNEGFDGVVECMSAAEIREQYVVSGDTYKESLARMIKGEGIYNDYAEDIRNA